MNSRGNSRKRSQGKWPSAYKASGNTSVGGNVKSGATRSNHRGHHHPKIPSKVRLFCEGSSIRGMHKITRAQTPFLRLLWLGFVLIMSIVLLMTSTFLVLDYLNYNTAFQTSNIIDDKTEFPAISVCSHNPFSNQANQIWRENRNMSPLVFQQRLLNASRYFVQKREGELSQLALYDNMETYYANLDFNSTLALGHKRDMIMFCMVKMVGYTTVAENCTLEKATPFRMRRFSHRDFFNCWTIEAKPENTSQEVDSLILLVTLIPSDEISQLNDTFVMDMLIRGEGLKLVVHEVNTYPDIDKHGINVQPGKMNEILYQPVFRKRYSSPKKPCKDGQKDIRDLDRVFNYSFQQCLDNAIQENIIRECGCMITLWPRPHIPNKDIPYCLRYDFDNALGAYINRTKCYTRQYAKIKSIKKEAQTYACLPRCNFYTYETSLSVTKWKPSANKLIRLTELYRAADKFMDKTKDDALQEEYMKILEKTKPDVRNRYEGMFTEDRFTYISLSRRSSDTTVMREKLVFDVYILLSRIGGLCSLFIGLTTAFFIELVEFVYLSFHVEKQRKNTLLKCNSDGGGGCSSDCNASNLHSPACAKTFGIADIKETVVTAPVEASAEHTDSASPWRRSTIDHGDPSYALNEEPVSSV